MTRVPVFIYASDPMSAAGAKAQLTREPTIEVVGPADIRRARVALIVADGADDAACRVARAARAEGTARVVLVATRFEESGVVAAVAAGVTGFLRRAEATSERLVAAIRDADEAGCQLPAGLLRKAASVRLHPVLAGSCGRGELEDRAPLDGAPLDGAMDSDTGADSGGGADLDTLPDPTVLANGVSAPVLSALVLSPREVEVLRLIAAGSDTAEVADRLAYSESTIKGVLAKVMVRLEARNRSHAVAVALRHGLI